MGSISIWSSVFSEFFVTALLFIYVILTIVLNFIIFIGLYFCYQDSPGQEFKII